MGSDMDTTKMTVLVVLLFTPMLYCTYMLYFHPLAKYPGPLSCKFCTFRATYHAWAGDLHLDIWHCHQKYGNIVRYGPGILIFNTPGSVRDIYAVGKNLTKHRVYKRLQRHKANILTVVDDKEHALRQRLLAYGLSQTSLKAFEPRLRMHVHRFCTAIGGSPYVIYDNDATSWGPGITLSDWCSYLTFDIMTDLAFGLEYNLLSSDMHRSVLKDINASTERSFCLLYTPLLLLGRVDKKVLRSSLQSRKRFLKFVDRMMNDRLSTEQAGIHEDILTSLHLMKDKDGSPYLDHETILSDATALTVAGYDTTSTALCAIFFYLSRCPSAYATLANEIRSQFQSLDDICTGQRLTKCNYLLACVDETLRLSPPVVTALFRETGPAGTIVDDQFIPSGTVVGTGIYSIHRNPEHFQQPHNFVPERWLRGFKDMIPVHNISAYMPFSRGSRACIGRSLSYLELQVTVAMVIWEYDFRPAVGADMEVGNGDPLSPYPGRRNPHEFQLVDRGTSGKQGPVLQFRRRQHFV